MFDGGNRLHLPGLRDDPLPSSRLTQALEQVVGVHGVRWNPACASLLLWHRRAGRLTEEELSEILHPLLQPAGSDRPLKERRECIEALYQNIFGRAIDAEGMPEYHSALPEVARCQVAGTMIDALEGE